MSDNDYNEFRPRVGRIRSLGDGRARTYLSRVAKAVSRAGGGPRLSAAYAAGSGLPARSWKVSRRAIVKARVVRLTPTGLARQAAHLAYIQRDGVSRAAGPAHLYNGGSDEADGEAFAERSRGDRHQFRFIISPEDTRELGELKPFVRDLMKEMSRDLGTELDWVAADHFDTDHPHTHVVLRGKEQYGNDLVIPRAYMSHGFRRRACEALTRELGPETAVEAYEKLVSEVKKDRLTRIDRRLLAAARDHVVTLDVRHGDGPLLASRLRHLEDKGLAARAGEGWRLAPELEATLRRMGERGDIIKTLHRCLHERGLARPLAPDAVWDGRRPEARVFAGRLVALGIADELTDRAYAIVDGFDGKARHVDLGLEPPSSTISEGALVEVRPNAPKGLRKGDLTIAQIAERSGGLYSEERHRAFDPAARAEFIRAHVRRLEALRRARLVKCGPEGDWTIPADYAETAANYDRAQAARAPARLALITDMSLSAQVAVHDATWLDRRLAGEGERGLAEIGLGREAREALTLRRRWLVREGLLADDAQGRKLPQESLAELRRRGLERIGASLSRDLGLPYAPAQDGERIDGTYVRAEMSGKGKVAVITRARDFTLVPWREVLDRNLGKRVSGVVRGDAISWDLTRKRGIGPT